MIVAESKSGGGAYIVPKFKPRDGDHYWIQANLESIEEIVRRVPKAKDIPHQCDGSHWSWYDSNADRLCDALRNYCDIRGPAPREECKDE